MLYANAHTPSASALKCFSWRDNVTYLLYNVVFKSVKKRSSLCFPGIGSLHHIGPIASPDLFGAPPQREKQLRCLGVRFPESPHKTGLTKGECPGKGLASGRP